MSEPTARKIIEMIGDIDSIEDDTIILAKKEFRIILREREAMLEKLKAIYLFSRENPGRGFTCGEMAKEEYVRAEGKSIDKVMS